MNAIYENTLKATGKKEAVIDFIETFFSSETRGQVNIFNVISEDDEVEKISYDEYQHVIFFDTENKFKEDFDKIADKFTGVKIVLEYLSPAEVDAGIVIWAGGTKISETNWHEGEISFHLRKRGYECE